MRSYANPVARAGDFADPFVLRHDGRYYLYATNPDVRCWSSSDLIHWQLEGPAIAPDTFPDLVPFAPEVVYADGAFFMYTSPSGHGHIVLRAERPTGPFAPVSGNVGHAIDGNVLIDDDGRWYFYWAGDEGIWGCEMPSPTEFGEPVLTGIHMNGWTEGPFVAKRDGRYWMTLTGNHYLSPGYRIDAASSDHPLTGYRPEPLNPLLVSTTGAVVGLGHSSSVRGPDLVSTWLAYHNLNADASRDLDIDRQVWTPEGLQILGPTSVAPAPSAPDEQCRWDAAAADAWTAGPDALVVHGTEGMLAAGATAHWDVQPGERFTAELNLTGAGHGLLLDDHVLRLPPEFDPAALHCWRLEADGDLLRIFIDGREQPVPPEAPRPPARIGVSAAARPVRIGHVALTRSVPALADRDAPRPVPGRFWATASEQQVFVQEAGRYAIYLGADRVDVRELGEGHGALALPAIAGPALVTVTRPPDGAAASVRDLTLEGFGKLIVDTATRDDVDLDAVIVPTFAEGESHADLLLRATQLSEGGEGDDTVLGIDFLLGYSVQLHRDRVVLARHAYDEQVLVSHAAPVAPEPHQLRVRARGDAISVELDGRGLFEVRDRLPYPAGSIGVRTANARLHVERLELAAGGDPTE